jgi:thiol:disulfide interchange protein
MERKTVLAVALLVLSGFLLSREFSDWNILSLSGALVVVLGIYLTFRDLAGTIDHVGGEFTQIIGGWRDELEASETKGVIGEIRKDSLQRSITNFQAATNELLALARSRARKLEAGCLMLGTLVSSGAWLVPKLLM